MRAFSTSHRHLWLVVRLQGRSLQSNYWGLLSYKLTTSGGIYSSRSSIRSESGRPSGSRDKRLLAASTAWANPRGVRLRDLHGRAGAADCELPSRGAGLQRGVSSVGGIRCRLVGGISFECCRRHLAKGREATENVISTRSTGGQGRSRSFCASPRKQTIRG